MSTSSTASSTPLRLRARNPVSYKDPSSDVDDDDERDIVSSPAKLGKGKRAKAASSDDDEYSASGSSSSDEDGSDVDTSGSDSSASEDGSDPEEDDDSDDDVIAGGDDSAEAVFLDLTQEAASKLRDDRVAAFESFKRQAKDLELNIPISFFPDYRFRMVKRWTGAVSVARLWLKHVKNGDKMRTSTPASEPLTLPAEYAKDIVIDDSWLCRASGVDVDVYLVALQGKHLAHSNVVIVSRTTRCAWVFDPHGVASEYVLLAVMQALPRDQGYVIMSVFPRLWDGPQSKETVSGFHRYLQFITNEGNCLAWCCMAIQMLMLGAQAGDLTRVFLGFDSDACTVMMIRYLSAIGNKLKLTRPPGDGGGGHSGRKAGKIAPCLVGRYARRSKQDIQRFIVLYDLRLASSAKFVSDPDAPTSYGATTHFFGVQHRFTFCQKDGYDPLLVDLLSDAADEFTMLTGLHDMRDSVGMLPGTGTSRVPLLCTLNGAPIYLTGAMRMSELIEKWGDALPDRVWRFTIGHATTDVLSQYGVFEKKRQFFTVSIYKGDVCQAHLKFAPDQLDDVQNMWHAPPDRKLRVIVDNVDRNKAVVIEPSVPVRTSLDVWDVLEQLCTPRVFVSKTHSSHAKYSLEMSSKKVTIEIEETPEEQAATKKKRDELEQRALRRAKHKRDQLEEQALERAKRSRLLSAPSHPPRIVHHPDTETAQARRERQAGAYLSC